MIISPVALLHKMNVLLLAVMKPLGIWGIGALAIVDSSSIPVPLDALLINFVARDHHRFLLYCALAGVGSAIGSLVPYYVGRAGGELFLLKRINRQRYEKLRDRFEKQEFLAIMIPAMLPPPMPVKLFEFAAGVFEMKVLPFALAIAVGKFIRFLAWSIITIRYGPSILHVVTLVMHQHLSALLGAVGLIALAIAVYILRGVFDRRRGTPLPVEEEASGPGDAPGTK